MAKLDTDKSAVRQRRAQRERKRFMIGAKNSGKPDGVGAGRLQPLRPPEAGPNSRQWPAQLKTLSTLWHLIDLDNRDTPGGPTHRADLRGVVPGRQGREQHRIFRGGAGELE